MAKSTSVTCTRCGGTGTIPQYAHVQNGICFKCRGTGLMDAHTGRVASGQFYVSLNDNVVELFGTLAECSRHTRHCSLYAGNNMSLRRATDAEIALFIPTPDEHDERLHEERMYQLYDIVEHCPSNDELACELEEWDEFTEASIVEAYLNDDMASVRRLTMPE